MGLDKHIIFSYVLMIVTLVIVASRFKITEWQYWAIIFGFSLVCTYREWIERKHTIANVKKNFLGLMPAFTNNNKFVSQFKMWSGFLDKALDKSK